MWPCPRCQSKWTHARFTHATGWRRQCGDCGEAFDVSSLEAPRRRRRTLGEQQLEDDPVCRRFAGLEVDE